MIRRDGAETRKLRIQQIAQTTHADLHKNNGEIPLDKTVAKLMLQTGLKKERIMEYMGILQNSGQFIIDLEGNRIKRACVS